MGEVAGPENLSRIAVAEALQRATPRRNRRAYLEDRFSRAQGGRIELGGTIRLEIYMDRGGHGTGGVRAEQTEGLFDLAPQLGRRLRTQRRRLPQDAMEQCREGAAAASARHLIRDLQGERGTDRALAFDGASTVSPSLSSIA